VAILLGLSPSLAQPKARDAAAAEELFAEARKLVEAGDYAAGCPKFEASLALYPSASTRLNIAACHEHQGKIATAIADYREALVLNRSTIGEERKKKLEVVAREGIRTLEPRLPRLRIVIAAQPSGLEVTRDGARLPLAVLGEALPIDPGLHGVSARAPGYRSETREVTLEEGKTTTVDLPLARLAPTSPNAVSDATQKEQGGVPTWVWISGGAGIALTGAAVYFLADDLSAISALRSNCTEVEAQTTCAQGYDFAADNARKNRGFALFLGLGSAGAAALGAAVVGLVRAPSMKAKRAPAVGLNASPWFGRGGGGVAIGGAF